MAVGGDITNLERTNDKHGNIAKGTTDLRVEFISQDHSSQLTNLEQYTISESRLSIDFKISIPTKYKVKILTKPSFRIVTKIRLHPNIISKILTKLQLQNPA